MDFENGFVCHKKPSGQSPFGFKNTGIQVYRYTGIQVYKNTRTQGHKNVEFFRFNVGRLIPAQRPGQALPRFYWAVRGIRSRI